MVWEQPSTLRALGTTLILMLPTVACITHSLSILTGKEPSRGGSFYILLSAAAGAETQLQLGELSELGTELGFSVHEATPGEVVLKRHLLQGHFGTHGTHKQADLAPDELFRRTEASQARLPLWSCPTQAGDQ